MHLNLAAKTQKLHDRTSEEPVTGKPPTPKKTFPVTSGPFFQQANLIFRLKQKFFITKTITIK